MLVQYDVYFHVFQMELKYHPSKFEEQREACKFLAPVNLIMATWQLIDARNAFGYSYDDLELGSYVFMFNY